MSTTTSIPPLRERRAWSALEQHYEQIRGLHLRELFAGDATRGERLVAEGAGLFLDYSKNRVTDETLKLLVQLAQQSGLAERTEAMFGGERINVSENRSVLHVALRMPKGSTLMVDGVNVVDQVHEVLDRMSAFADRVRSGEWKGHTGKAIRNIVNIGIGGSDLGPVMAYEALRHYSRRDLTFRFVSNVDSTDFVEATHDLDAERDPVHRLLQDLHHAGDDDQRPFGARLGPERARATRARSPSTSWRSPPTPRRCRSSASTPTTCSASGSGSAGATRWTRPSGSRRCWPSGPTASPSCWPASTTWTSTSGPPRSSATCRC